MIGFARPDLLAPAIGLVAQDLVGVAAVGQLDDAHVVQRDPRVVPRQLADQLLERRGAERARLLARGVDVVGEGDPLRVAGDQRDLLRASARCRGEATTLSNPAWWAISASV